MRIIVSDTSCMIDLRKAALLGAILALPYTLMMPDTLFEDEWLNLSASDKEMLRDGGLELRELPGPAVTRAAAYFNRHSRLALGDCFALTLAEEVDGSILLTGDAPLREVAEGKGIEIHGVLATRLHFNRDFRLNSQSLAACLTPERTIGGTAWPSFRLDIPECDMLWANTTLRLEVYS